MYVCTVCGCSFPVVVTMAIEWLLFRVVKLALKTSWSELYDQDMNCGKPEMSAQSVALCFLVVLYYNV